MPEPGDPTTWKSRLWRPRLSFRRLGARVFEPENFGTGPDACRFENSRRGEPALSACVLVPGARSFENVPGGKCLSQGVPAPRKSAFRPGVQFPTGGSCEPGPRLAFRNSLDAVVDEPVEVLARPIARAHDERAVERLRPGPEAVRAEYPLGDDAIVDQHPALRQRVGRNLRHVPYAAHGTNPSISVCGRCRWKRTRHMPQVNTGQEDAHPSVDNDALIQNPVEQVDHLGLVGSTPDHRKFQGLHLPSWRRRRLGRNANLEVREGLVAPLDDRPHDASLSQASSSVCELFHTLIMMQ